MAFCFWSYYILTVLTSHCLYVFWLELVSPSPCNLRATMAFSASLILLNQVPFQFQLTRTSPVVLLAEGSKPQRCRAKERLGKCWDRSCGPGGSRHLSPIMWLLRQLAKSQSGVSLRTWTSEPLYGKRHLSIAPVWVPAEEILEHWSWSWVWRRGADGQSPAAYIIKCTSEDVQYSSSAISRSKVPDLTWRKGFVVTNETIGRFWM